MFSAITFVPSAAKAASHPGAFMDGLKAIPFHEGIVGAPYLALFARCGKETQLKTEPVGNEPLSHISRKREIWGTHNYPRATFSEAFKARTLTLQHQIGL
jgi:hypothetical protein